MKRPSWFSVVLAGQLAAAAGFSLGQGSRRIVAYLIVWSGLALLVRAGHRRWPLPRGTLWFWPPPGASTWPVGCSLRPRPARPSSMRPG